MKKLLPSVSSLPIRKMKRIYFVTSFVMSVLIFIFYFLFFKAFDCDLYLSIIQGLAFGLLYFWIVIPENLKIRVVLIKEILFLVISQVFYYILELQTYSIFAIPFYYIFIILIAPILVLPALSYVILVSYYQRKLFYRMSNYQITFYFQLFTSIPYLFGILWFWMVIFV
jgi:hypothetical protein